MTNLLRRNFARCSSFVFALGVSSAALAVEGTPTPNDPRAGTNPNAGPTTPANVEEASARFERGLRFYEEGDFGLALIEFERAHQLVSDYRLLYNIGQVSIQLGRFARARIALERYVREGGLELPADRREAVDRDLAMLRERTAHLTVRVSEPGAEVTVDEVVRGTTPLGEPLLLDAGEHRILVTKAGFEPLQRRLTLAGAEESTIEGSLVREKSVDERPPEEPTLAPARPTAPQKEVPAESTPWRTTTWITAGVLAASATTTAILALSERSTLEGLKNEPAAATGTLEAQASKVNTFFAVTDGLALGALAFAALGVYLEWSAPSASGSASASAASGSTLRITPTDVTLGTSF